MTARMTKMIGVNKMMNNKQVAKDINDLMLEYQGRLSESVSLVRENCDDAEVYAYRKAIGEVLAKMILGVMNPIYDTHPELKPEVLK